MFETVRNAFKLKEIRSRIIYTLLMLVVVRIGTQLPIPGVNGSYFSEWFSGNSGSAFGFFDAITGGSFEKMSVFALNITPYITSSIIIQLLTIAIPKLEELQKDGEEGRKKMTAITRYVTVGLALFESIAMAIGFGRQGMIPNLDFFKGVVVVACLTAGSAMLMWLGERITDKGIGNGISLIIMIGIIARLPQAFIQEVSSRFTAITGGGLVMFIVEILILYAVVCASLLLVQGTRKIPVQYAKRIVGNKQYGGARQYVPLKLFAANVMPIIFAQALMFIPLAIVQYSTDQSGYIIRSLMDHRSLLYNIVFAALIIAFTYFYTALTLNATQMAEDMKRNNGFIPGIKPGKDTADYIDTVMSRITFPGSLFIAFIAVMPALAGLLNVQDAFSQFFGGTSLLILVGVVLDTLQQIESHLMMRHYDGLMKSGKIKGRSGAY